MTVDQGHGIDLADHIGRAGPEVARVLLVSGPGRWADHVDAGLAAEGFRVLRDPTGEWAFDEARIAPIDVVVVDLRLPAQSGLAVCGAIRARSAIPVLAIGDRSEETSVLAAYAAGADQYVTVDTSTRLVVARLRALLRRVPARPGPAAPAAADQSVRIVEASGAVMVGGSVVRLSRRELEVLRSLVARPGRVVTRVELAGTWPALSADRRLDFVIRRLRQKLEAVDGRRRISAVRGVGFRFEEEPEVDMPPVLGGPGADSRA